MAEQKAAGKRKSTPKTGRAITSYSFSRVAGGFLRSVRRFSLVKYIVAWEYKRFVPFFSTQKAPIFQGAFLYNTYERRCKWMSNFHLAIL